MRLGLRPQVPAQFLGEFPADVSGPAQRRCPGVLHADDDIGRAGNPLCVCPADRIPEQASVRDDVGIDGLCHPSLLAVDLAVLVNRRPRAMLWCVLLGGVGMAVLIGLVDVLVVKTDLVRTQGSLSLAADLALGLLLLAVGMLLVTSRFRRKPKPAPDRGSADKSNWMQRALRQPRLGLAVVVGAVLGLPGAVYLTAPHLLVSDKSPTDTRVVAVFLFAIIEFTLIIVPLILLTLRPKDAAAMIGRSQEWLKRHGRQLSAYVALGLGAYLTISSLVSLLG